MLRSGSILLCLSCLSSVGCGQQIQTTTSERRSSQITPSTTQKAPATLQERARVFLERPIPKGITYVPDSFAERFIKKYAAEGKVKNDPESLELIEICATESQEAAKKSTGEEQEYFRESAEILKAILAEAAAQ